MHEIFLLKIGIQLDDGSEYEIAAWAGVAELLRRVLLDYVVSNSRISHPFSSSQF